MCPAIRSHYNRLRARHPDTMPLLPSDDTSIEVACMLAGVYLNGREYKRGNYCEYLPYVRPRGNLPAVAGGELGSSASYLLARIECFYVFRVADQMIALAQITDLPVLGNVRSLRIVQRLTHPIRKGFEDFWHIRHAAPADVLIIHIDSITHKMFLAPHFDEPSKMCAMRVWEAR